jgi:hypothetical protein
MLVRHTGRAAATCFAYVLVIQSPIVLAEDRPWTSKDAYHQATDEALQCHAFYRISQKCSDDTNASNKLANNLGKAADDALKIGIAFSMVAGMSSAGTVASGDLAMNAEMDSINKDCINLAVLILKYGKFCRLFLEKPDARVNTLLRGPADGP